MESSVTLWNFDGTYRRQSFYLRSNYTSIDLEYMRNISLFCEKAVLWELADRIRNHPSSNIHYLGSGNYHYISYILQSQINEPYTLVLFDHHTDTLPAPSESLISCGSWVLESIHNLPMLKKVFIIGVSEDAYLHIPKDVQNKVAVYTEHSLQSNLPTIIKSILTNLPTKSIYISMDKDVLLQEEALTAWDHGTLRLKQMMGMVKALYRTKSIIGVDICGEYPVNPSTEYHKRTKEALEKNDRANGFILQSIQHWNAKRHKPSRLLHA
ncbi:arginase family protein [Ornithinibacillus sp. BX22]|uniref:Arginase family protein n=1 Tax=Ornithinibacillus hominis TaxID=2763055 RepID=A0A923L811_9BACI|nr:arginase family protein [Ornithinibacillus hominis]MBC5638114.1 arginase family protein [Ornithinibacillus hominis]